jgi:hypothetical protein
MEEFIQIDGGTLKPLSSGDAEELNMLGRRWFFVAATSTPSWAFSTKRCSGGRIFASD